MMKHLKIGTRDSALAVVQAELVAKAVREYDPGIAVRLVPMKTTGDQILDRPLDQIGGKGLFVKELDQALLDGRVDITVHSCKDLPMELDERLPVVAVSKREDPRDALVLPLGCGDINRARPVGCSSARRRIQLRRLYPDLAVTPVRGNVQTRLQKLDRGEYGALVLAAAGLNRLSLQHRISRTFHPEEMLPAACQGFLAVQARRGENTDYLALFHDEESKRCALTERAFVRALDGGCSKPCAAYASVQEDGRILLRGMYAGEDERRVLYDAVLCSVDAAEREAAALAERMRDEGER